MEPLEVFSAEEETKIQVEFSEIILATTKAEVFSVTQTTSQTTEVAFLVAVEIKIIINQGVCSVVQITIKVVETEMEDCSVAETKHKIPEVVCSEIQGIISNQEEGFSEEAIKAVMPEADSLETLEEIITKALEEVDYLEEQTINQVIKVAVSSEIPEVQLNRIPVGFLEGNNSKATKEEDYLVVMEEQTIILLEVFSEMPEGRIQEEVVSSGVQINPEGDCLETKLLRLQEVCSGVQIPRRILEVDYLEEVETKPNHQEAYSEVRHKLQATEEVCSQHRLNSKL